MTGGNEARIHNPPISLHPSNNSYKPYSNYKDSGLPWLGKVPAHWAVAPGFLVLSEQKIKNKGMIEKTVLSLSYGKIVIKPPEKLHGLVPESFETYQIVSPGNIIIRSTDLQNDYYSLRVGKVKDRGIITSAYLCFVTKGKLSPDYCYLLLHAYDLMKIFYGMGSGLRQNLDFSDFKRMPVLIPPEEEQAHLVKYIEEIDKKISRFIRNKQKLVKLFKEQKQAIINQAVTRGIDPNVRLKPSGVEWLGDIPEHWEVKPLKRWARINERVLPEATDLDFEIEYIDIGSVSTGFLGRKPERMIFRNAPSRARRILRKGDTIISTVRTYLKAIYFVSGCSQNLIASTGFAVLTPSEDIYPKFLSYIIQNVSFIDKVSVNSIGIAYPAIGESRFKSLHVAMPTNFNEQQAIVGRIEQQSVLIDTAITRAQREIELIREYRIRLIADVVTGKIDVRDIPVGPLEEGEEPEEIDTPEELAELPETEEVQNGDD